ncbi:hypothetical protein ABZX65_22470 [Streptomyces sp. NPDC003300]|uniref:hypothetical protein n=1 Tax=unclassified Streptomyces TaxID=2593676 RepID=UPI00339E96F8
MSENTGESALGEDEDAAFFDRLRRWQARYDDGAMVGPMPRWWPWPLEEVTFDDGDPDSGLIVIGLEPVLAPRHSAAEAGRPYAKLARQPAGEPPYRFGWAGLAWGLPPLTEEEAAELEAEPLDPVVAYSWHEADWQWHLFTNGGQRRLTAAEVTRIRENLDHDHRFPPGFSSFRL